MAQNEQHEDKEPQTGPGLGRALGGLRKETVFIPPSIDEAVLRGARPHLARLRARHSRRQRAQWVALAACVVLMAVIAQAVFHRGGKQFAREDLNRDGQVDILDAFQLAREIKEDSAQIGDGDFNGDGKVDAADVEILARRAVSLEKGGPS